LAILNTMTTAITLTETDRPDMIDTMSDTPLGLTEIGELLGVSRQRAFTLSKRADFPAPSATLKAGRIWDRADVEAWEATWDRSNQGGRPKRKPVENAPPPAAEPEAEIARPTWLGDWPDIAALTFAEAVERVRELEAARPEWFAETRADCLAEAPWISHALLAADADDPAETVTANPDRTTVD
jgi:predicted DNA-binding transcriptional regulator AlpA